MPSASDCVKFWVKNAGKKYFYVFPDGRINKSVIAAIGAISLLQYEKPAYMFELARCGIESTIFTYPSVIIADIVCNTHKYYWPVDEQTEKKNIWLELEKNLFEQAHTKSVSS